MMTESGFAENAEPLFLFPERLVPHLPLIKEGINVMHAIISNF